MLSLARDDVSLPSKDDELLDYDELIRGIDEQLLAIDALPLPSPPPAAAVPFSVPPSPLSANAATSPARERQEPSIGFKEPSIGPNPQVWIPMQAGSTPFSIFPSDQRTPEATGISDGRATESAAAAEESLLQQPEAAAAQEWVVAAAPELSGWEAPSGAESIDVDATSSVRKRQEPALANAVAFQQLESPRRDSSSSAGASRADMELGHARQRPPPQPPPPQRVCLTARL